MATKGWAIFTLIAIFGGCKGGPDGASLGWGSYAASSDGGAGDAADAATSDGPPEPAIMSLRLYDKPASVFVRKAVTQQGVLEALARILEERELPLVVERFGGHGHPSSAPRFTAGDISKLAAALAYLKNDFPLAPNVGSQPLAAGEKTFTDAYGNYFTTKEPDLFTPLPFTSTYELTFFAGRHTALAPSTGSSLQVELVAQDIRYRIHAFDSAGVTP